MIQRWQVGAATLTSVVEDETRGIPPELFFPAAKAADVARHPWLVPEFADANGRIALRVQAFAIELRGRALFLGTHFAARPAGRVERQGRPFRFVPL